MRGALLTVLALLSAGCLGATADVEPASTSSLLTYRAGSLAALAPGAAASAAATLHPVGYPTNEPSIAVSNDGSLYVIAAETLLRSQDDGATWEPVREYAITPRVDLPNGGWLTPLPPSLDPWVWADPISGRVFANHLTLACTSLSWSDDDGDSWSPWWYGACAAPLVDFQKIVTGPPGPEPNAKAGAQFESVVYMCYNKFVGDFVFGLVPAGTYGLACAASYDGGLVWENEALLSRVFVANGEVVEPVSDSCSGGAWIPAVAPDGTVVVRGQGDPACMFRTRDSGATWQHVGEGPAFGGTHLAFDDAGTLYAMSGWWEGPILVSVSRDQGDTWEDPFTVMPPGVHGPLFPTLVAGGTGKLFIPFWGTDSPIEDVREGAGDDARWHAWLLAIEGADTAEAVITAHRATPDDAPMYIGAGWPDMRSGLWMGDFITGTIGPDGTPYAVFPQACNDGCAGDPDATRDDQTVLGTVVALRGWTMR